MYEEINVIIDLLTCREIYDKLSDEKSKLGTSLAVQWLRLHLPMQEVCIQFLVGELRSHMRHSQNIKKH